MNARRNPTLRILLVIDATRGNYSILRFVVRYPIILTSMLYADCLESFMPEVSSLFLSSTFPQLGP